MVLLNASSVLQITSFIFTPANIAAPALTLKWNLMTMFKSDVNISERRSFSQRNKFRLGPDDYGSSSQNRVHCRTLLPGQLVVTACEAVALMVNLSYHYVIQLVKSASKVLCFKINLSSMCLEPPALLDYSTMRCFQSVNNSRWQNIFRRLFNIWPAVQRLEPDTYHIIEQRMLSKFRIQLHVTCKLCSTWYYCLTLCRKYPC